MYADDMLLYCDGTDLTNMFMKVYEDLEYVKTWLDHNKLSLNVEKHKYILGTRTGFDLILGELIYGIHDWK